LLQKNNEGIPASPLHILAGKFGRLFEEITLRIHTISGGCKPFLTYVRARRLGEIIFPFFIMILCYITYCCISTLFSYPISIIYSEFVSVAFASLICFSFLVLKETVIVLGEIELKSFQGFAREIYDCFFTFRIWLLIGFMLGLILLVDEILEFGFRLPATEVEKIRWIDSIACIPSVFIFTSFTIPIFFSFGAFLYGMWNYIYRRYPNRVFRCNFLEIAPSIEKLAEISVHIVLFFASMLFLNEIFVRKFYANTPLSMIYAETQTETMNFFYYSLYYGAVILPLVLYFLYLGNLYLGKIVRDLKAMEFRWIDEKMKISHSSEEKEALAAYRAEVSKALRWIGGVDYTARLLLLAYIGYILSKVMGMSII